MPRFDHRCLRLVPLGNHEELLHLNDTSLAPRNRRTELRSSRMKSFGHDLSLLAEFEFKSLEKRVLQVLSGHGTDTEQEAGELRAEPLAGCSCFPPCSTLAPELLRENWVILEIGAFQIVLDEDILVLLARPMSIKAT